MERFGYTRLYREKISVLHKLYFKIAGVSPDHKLRFKYCYKFIVNNIDKSKIKSILDAGCGGGDYSFYFSKAFPNSQITAIDIDRGSIERNLIIQKKVNAKNVEFKAEDLSSINYSNEFDIIICVDVLEHIIQQKKVLQLFYESLRHGGYLFIHMPLERLKPVIFNRYLKEFYEWAEEEHIAPSQTADKFLKLISDCGFEIENSKKTFNHYFGEFAVSLITLFYKKNAMNNFVKAILSPFLNILTLLDLVISNKSGNAIAILAKK